jgi:hypothetical protein
MIVLWLIAKIKQKSYKNQSRKEEKMPEPAIVSNLYDLSWLPIGTQIQIGIKSKVLLIVFDKLQFKKDISSFSDSVALYLNVFGLGQITSIKAREILQSKYGLETNLYFESDLSFILFVSSEKKRLN